jgi:GTPase
LFDRPQTGERAFLLHLDTFARPLTLQAREEFAELARSAGAELVGDATVKRRAPDARFLIGSGKVEELKDAVANDLVELVLVDHPLSPSQERNLEKEICCRVLDRTGLILDIFAQRARTSEGKLQVELAQLRHLSTRLIRGWTHLERQKGGIGLRGPGETQLETDRRLLNNRIRILRGRIEQLTKRRDQRRRQRVRAEIPTVALVGYTNAGKSTLFNAITQSKAYAADKLFATLDPTVRRVRLPRGVNAVLADTVGFVRDLPHELVAAFRSTLQEAREADLLLHVIDGSDEEHDERIQDVQGVLDEIEAGTLPVVEVYNKVDLIEQGPRVDLDEAGLPRRVWVSAVTGDGLELLVDALERRLYPNRVQGNMMLTAAQGRARAGLHTMGAIRAETDRDGGGWQLEIELPVADYLRFCRREGLEPELAAETGVGIDATTSIESSTG